MVQSEVGGMCRITRNSTERGRKWGIGIGTSVSARHSVLYQCKERWVTVLGRLWNPSASKTSRVSWRKAGGQVGTRRLVFGSMGIRDASPMRKRVREGGREVMG